MLFFYQDSAPLVLIFIFLLYIYIYMLIYNAYMQIYVDRQYTYMYNCIIEEDCTLSAFSF